MFRLLQFLLILALFIFVFSDETTSTRDENSEAVDVAVQKQAESCFGRYYRNKGNVHRMRELMNKHRRRFRNGKQRFGREREARKFEERLGDMRRVSYGPAGKNAEGESPINDYLYQGDILLSEDQAEAIFNETINPINSRHRRNAYTSKSARWNVSQPIYVEFYNLSSSSTAMIRDSLAFWQKETCVNFEESTTKIPRLRFIKGSGCWSLVGKSSVVSVQDISIETGCEYYRTICHEIGHALGLFHHQARPDRDNYVTIVAENIKDRYLDQYTKQTNKTCNSYGVAYDVGSVMHYKQREFAKSPNLITVLAKAIGYQNSLASNRWPSFADVKIINSHLCSATCPSSLTCENNGYPDPNNCNQCKCPSSLIGRTCGRRHPGNGMHAWKPECGADLVATEVWTGVNMTVGEKTSTVYKNINNCFWVIRAPPGRTLDSWVTRAPSGVCSDACETQGMRVTTTTTEATGATYCCGTADPRQLTTTSDTLVIELYSYQGISDAWVFYRLTPQ